MGSDQPTPRQPAARAWAPDTSADQLPDSYHRLPVRHPQDAGGVTGCGIAAKCHLDRQGGTFHRALQEGAFHRVVVVHLHFQQVYLYAPAFGVGEILGHIGGNQARGKNPSRNGARSVPFSHGPSSHTMRQTDAVGPQLTRASFCMPASARSRS